MSGLLVVFCIGLLAGGLLYVLAWTILKGVDIWERIALLVVISVLGIVGGLAIGGFEGMPISLMGAAVLMLSFLLWIGAKSRLWQKWVLIVSTLAALAGILYTLFS